ncbi:MAG: hypothetical protein CMJ59_23895 [Planctomycetaceae bacterium]|nr:hypothetical protein [Planctomycetaceae bacterium]MAV38491.1 hypothetical protein [Planctomycetaceae bacterium]
MEADTDIGIIEAVLGSVVFTAVMISGIRLLKKSLKSGNIDWSSHESLRKGTFNRESSPKSFWAYVITIAILAIPVPIVFFWVLIVEFLS